MNCQNLGNIHQKKCALAQKEIPFFPFFFFHRARVYKTVTLERGSSGLGFSIVGGFGSPHGDLPIYIKTIFNKVRALPPGSEAQGTAWDSETECSHFQRVERDTYGPIITI